MFFFIVAALVLVSNSNVLGACPQDWTKYDVTSTCLLYSWETELSFENAVKYCVDRDAELARFDNFDKGLFAYNIMDVSGISWIPIKDFGQGDFKYVDETELGSYQSDWKDDVTAYSSDSQHDCLVRYGSDGSFVWSNKDCTETYSFVCEKPEPPVECDKGWRGNRDNDACIKVVKRKRLNFNRASKDCEARGGTLATSVTTRGQRSDVMDQMKFRGQVWIGVHSPQNDGTFKYIDGTSLTDEPPFKKGRPKTSSINYCVSLKQGKWFDKKCKRRLHYVCQKAPNGP